MEATSRETTLKVLCRAEGISDDPPEIYYLARHWILLLWSRLEMGSFVEATALRIRAGWITGNGNLAGEEQSADLRESFRSVA
jgi:hypothetical protein